MSKNADSPLLVPVILAGGAGTRLWPLSREQMPKQFISLFGDELSTFQATIKRVSGHEFGRPVVVTGDDFRFMVAEQMKEIGITGEIVLEPERRDSAASVAVGALVAARMSENAVCVVLAADHAISDESAFVADCLRAAEAARLGHIVTLGIQPTGPSSAYGYIAVGKETTVPGAYELKRFVEKPDAAAAQRYVEQGLLWNSGNFVFDPATMITEMGALAPEVLQAARESLESAQEDLDFLRLDAEAFKRAPRVSIDYAVMEKTKSAGVVRASFGWSDVGTWDALHELAPRDADGNLLEGPVTTIDTTNSLVRSGGVLTAVVGLDGVVVVTTPDAVLVAAKDQASRVKELVAKMTVDGHSEALEHLRVHRPWGWYQRIDIGDRFQVKHICVKPGGTLSLQKHHHRAEHWVVVRGTAEVTIDGTVKLYHENEAAYLPIGCVHRMRNPGKIDLRIIEVQVGSYTGEDDIVRLEDVYDRN